MTHMHAEPMLDALVRERYRGLVAFAAMVNGGRTEAPDIVHDALISVFGRRRSFPNINAADAYVRRAITSRYLDAARKNGRARDTEKRYTSRVSARHEDAYEADTRLETALRDLAPRVRVCVVLRYLEDLSIRDTAAATGLSDGAVKRYVSDGLAHLNQALGMTEELNDSDSVAVSSEGSGS